MPIPIRYGYDVYILAKDEKCETNSTIIPNQHVLESKPTYDLVRCSNLCDEDRKCKYFLFDNQKYCETYDDCSTTQKAENKGSIYKKKSRGKIHILSDNYPAKFVNNDNSFTLHTR